MSHTHHPGFQIEGKHDSFCPQIGILGFEPGFPSRAIVKVGKVSRSGLIRPHLWVKLVEEFWVDLSYQYDTLEP